MIEAILHSETPVLTRAIQDYIPEDGSLQPTDVPVPFYFTVFKLLLNKAPIHMFV
jgi:hypothetical protein